MGYCIGCDTWTCRCLKRRAAPRTGAMRVVMSRYYHADNHGQAR
jgi:hypothetical protein